MENEFIQIKSARVNFPHLFKKPVINGEEGKCGAQLMLDPETNAGAIKEIKTAITEILKERNKGKKIPGSKLCLQKGEERGRDEYEGLMVLSANAKGFPVVISGDGKTKIESEEDSNIYGGCYCNAKVRLWFQDNKYGKRVNCELVAIQFAKDGEPLDGSYVSEETAMEGFDATEEPRSEASGAEEDAVDDMFD